VRYAVISDIHANVEALSAVLAAIDEEHVDAILCLGDIVGYGASPNECVRLVAASGAKCVAGNHDRAALGLRSTSSFGRSAKRAMVWTKRLLQRETREWLASAPFLRRERGEILLFHAALHPVPNDDLHLSTLPRLQKSLEAMIRGTYGTRVGLFGHTHHPGVWRSRNGAFGPAPGETVPLDEGTFYLINPGSVGQPRDGDPRASFALLDRAAGVVRFRRVPYDTTLAMAKVAAIERETERLAPLAWLSAGFSRGLGLFAGQRR